MIYRSEHPTLPAAMGTEEELAIQYNNEAFIGLLRHIPADITASRGAKSNDYFYANGYRAYLDNNHLEICTPECSGPTELTTYIRGAEHILVEAGKNFIERLSDDLTQAPLRIQRRVIDPNGTSWGCHDNFSVSFEQAMRLKDSGSVQRQALLGHLASRSFVTGAGLVAAQPNASLSFSQKITTLESETGYCYASNMQRVNDMDETMHHRVFEVRCNDVNISDWATSIRVGSTALALFFSQTSLKDHLYRPEPGQALRTAQAMNGLTLTPEMTIQNDPVLAQAVDAQRTLAEITLKHLDKYVDQEISEYMNIASELYTYCDDMRSVMHGHNDITLLADRSDWARKFSFIHRHMEKDERPARYYSDAYSRELDYAYDMILISPGLEQATVRYGLGYLARDRNKFQSSVSEEEYVRASRTAPENTRAAVRAQLIEKYADYAKVFWNSITYTRNATQYEYPMLDVSDSCFHPLQERRRLAK